MKAKLATKKPRVRPIPRHRTFRLTKKKMSQYEPIPGAPKLLKQSLAVIFKNKRVFFGIAILHGLITFVFVQGLGSSFDLVQTKDSLQQILGNNSNKVSNGVALFGYLAGTASSGVTESSGAYQIIMAFIASLAVIWATRQVLSGEKPSILDVFYKGMYPLIPFVILVGVVSLEFIPFAVGNVMYGAVIQNGLAVTSVEKFLWFLLLILFALLTLYMVISSIFSLYIVTLPDVRPLNALRSARELVLHRRTAIALRVIALPLAILLTYMVIFIPVIIFATVIADPLFLFATSFIIVFFHVYMYTLYRSLL